MTPNFYLQPRSCSELQTCLSKLLLDISADFSKISIFKPELMTYPSLSPPYPHLPGGWNYPAPVTSTPQNTKPVCLCFLTRVMLIFSCLLNYSKVNVMLRPWYEWHQVIRGQGTWVAQWIEHPTLDLSSGLDFKVMSSRPTLGSTLGLEPT